MKKIRNEKRNIRIVGRNYLKKIRNDLNKYNWTTLKKKIDPFNLLKLKSIGIDTKLSIDEQLKIILMDKDFIKKKRKNMTQEELALLKLVKLHKGLSKNILFSYDNIDKLRLNGESKMRTHIKSFFIK